jgi:hypothetical protein
MRILPECHLRPAREEGPFREEKANRFDFLVDLNGVARDNHDVIRVRGEGDPPTALDDFPAIPIPIARNRRPGYRDLTVASGVPCCHVPDVESVATCAAHLSVTRNNFHTGDENDLTA